MNYAMLPGGLPEVGYRSPEYGCRFLTSLIDFNGSLTEKRRAQEQHTKLLFKRVRYRGNLLCPPSFEMDPWTLLHERDYDYVRALPHLDARGEGHPFQFWDDYLMFSRPILSRVGLW